MEIVAEVNERDEVIGARPRDDFYRTGRWHRTSYLLIFNTAGQLLLQKRSPKKLLYPSLYDYSCSGLVEQDESYEDAIKREMQEELGFRMPFDELFTYTYQDGYDAAFKKVFIAVCDGPFALQEEEVRDAHWVDPALLKEDLERHAEAFTKPFIEGMKRYFADHHGTSPIGKPLKSELVSFTSHGVPIKGERFAQGSDRCIILVHSFRGDMHEWGRYDRLALELYAKGFDVFRFDCSGCGASGDDTITIAKMQEDLSAVIDRYRHEYRALGAYGHSLGGLLALRFAADFAALVLSAPVTDRKEYVTTLSPEQRAELGEKGCWTHTRQFGARRSFTIGAEFITERSAINQQVLLSGVSSPTLIIHGDKDESVPVEQSQRADEILGTSKLVILPGGRHALFAQWHDVVNLTTMWFSEKLPKGT